MADWRERTGVEMWMLFNLSTALRKRGRQQTATEVSRHALTLPSDHTHSRVVAAMALEDAMAEGGRSGKARKCSGQGD